MTLHRTAPAVEFLIGQTIAAQSFVPGDQAMEHCVDDRLFRLATQRVEAGGRSATVRIDPSGKMAVRGALFFFTNIQPVLHAFDLTMPKRP